MEEALSRSSFIPNLELEADRLLIIYLDSELSLKSLYFLAADSSS